MRAIQNFGADSYAIDGNLFETQYEPPAKREQVISFSKPAGYQFIATGIRGLDMGNGHNLRLNTFAEHINDHQYRAGINTWSDAKVYKSDMAWLRVTGDNPFNI